VSRIDGVYSVVMVGLPDSALLTIANRLDCVLLSSERTAGLETFARLVHESGPHAAGNFLTFSASRLPEVLAEVELFGFAGGAFPPPTGRHRAGRLLRASGGTLFISEIEHLGLLAQKELLRVIDRREVRPLKFDGTCPVQTRLIAGTGGDLADAVAAGRFRRDLYERLAATVIAVPPATQLR